jgi:hypothetical protein
MQKCSRNPYRNAALFAGISAAVVAVVLVSVLVVAATGMASPLGPDARDRSSFRAAAPVTAPAAAPVASLGVAWHGCAAVPVSYSYDQGLSNLEVAAVEGSLARATEGLRVLTGKQLHLQRVQAGSTAAPGTIHVSWSGDDALFLGNEVGFTVLYFVEALIIRAEVTISLGLLDRYEVGNVDDRGESVTAVVLHELGHAVGLGHSIKSDSVMHVHHGTDTHVTSTDRLGFEQAGDAGC